MRVVLQMRSATRLQVHQAAELYALLAEASGRSHAADPAVPEGLILEAVEQCRTRLNPGDCYAFGFTLLSGSEAESKARLPRLLDGLRAVGAHSRLKNVVFGGNFTVLLVEDLVAGREYEASRSLAAISTE